MRKKARYVLIVVFLLLFQHIVSVRLSEYAKLQYLTENCVESDKFRDMKISLRNLQKIRAFSEENEMDFAECLSILMITHDFHLQHRVEMNKNQILRMKTVLQEKKPDACQQVIAAYEKVFSDIRYFPLPGQSRKSGRKQFFFENGYGEARSYGGTRSHEGIDIFGASDIDGYYPVVSMTDGVIEKVGWLPLGGYRIGVRSPGGGYFYYAHLSAYEQRFQPGDRVKAGELLGLMGDTGYGGEGTRGRFPVHLHLGIYISTAHQEEVSVNPYPVLLLSEKEIEEYQY